jgi:hypothetical protein
MLHEKKHFFLQSIIALILAFLPLFCFADDKVSFEVGVGAGKDFQDLKGDWQLLVAPALGTDISASGSIRLRVEGDLEFIDDTEKMVFVGGIAPFVRLMPFDWKINPFLELGAGGNLSTNRTIGNQYVGGPFLFSLMAGGGTEIKINGTPLGVSYRFRHLSNAGIYKANEGFNSQYIMLSTRF